MKKREGKRETSLLFFFKGYIPGCFFIALPITKSHVSDQNKKGQKRVHTHQLACVCSFIGEKFKNYRNQKCLQATIYGKATPAVSFEERWSKNLWNFSTPEQVKEPDPISEFARFSLCPKNLSFFSPSYHVHSCLVTTVNTTVILLFSVFL